MPESSSFPLTRQAYVLQEILAPMGAIAVAFSGGLDSRLLIHSALLAGLDVTAIHVSGPHIPAAEEAEAAAWAAARAVPLITVQLDVLAISAVAAGARDRCYHCKRALFDAMLDAAGALPLCDGTNASDKTKYRPGLKALEELGIRSPLAEAGLTKAAIHALAEETGMDRPGQAARPCLLTRLDYGLTPEAGMLAAIDAAERAVAAMLCRHRLTRRPDVPGEPVDFRLRVENGPRYSLHLATENIPTHLEKALHALLEERGFTGASLVSGSEISGHFDRKARLM
ncbi:hypothetical protein LJC23_01825 [Desulfovibrio sp. OttesenSCG-928-I05]|nr:hypothetical protein [Desulfovibrio sp. OttesenSCG-928-I05]